LGALGDLLEDGLAGLERVARLVDVRELDGVADRDVAGVGRLLPDDHAEERGLARAVRPDDADDAGPWQREAQVLDEQPVTEALAEAIDLDHLVAQSGPRRDRDLELTLLEPAGVVGLREELLVGRQPSLALRLAGLGRQAHPFELAGQRALAGVDRLLLLGEAPELLLEPGRVVARERDAAPAIELEDPLGDVVEEVA